MSNPSDLSDLPEKAFTINHPSIHPWLSKPIFWFVVALVIRLLYLLEEGGTSPLFYQPMLDEREAVDSAMAILRGTPAAEPYFKAPGYSWIMAAIMSISGDAWPWTVRAVQHLAGAWLVGMVAWLAGLLSPTVPWRKGSIAVAGFLAAVYAPLIRLENNLSLDFWSVFFQSAMLCVLARTMLTKSPRRNGILAGCLAAAAWLVRPTITVVLPFLALWLAIKPRHKSRIDISGFPSPKGLRRLPTRFSLGLPLLFLLPALIAAGAVIVRNYATSGEPIAMPWQGGYSLYYANNSNANGRYYLQSQIVETDHPNPTKHLAVEGFKQSLSAADFIAFEQDPVYAAVDDFWFNRTISVIKSDPAAWAKLMGKKVIYLFSDKEIFNYEDFDLQRSRSAILHWMPGRFGVIFPLAMASVATLGLTRFRRRRIHELLVIYTITLGGGIALYYASGRMRMPLAFPMIAFAGYTAAGFPRLKTSRKLIALFLLTAGAVLSWGDWWGVRSESMAHVDLGRMSNAAWHKGDYQQALDLAVEAEKRAPDYPVLPRLKGQALYNLGHIVEAKLQFQRSVRLLGDETSRKNLKTIDEELAR